MNINGETKALGIIGYPVRHTLSPEIHRLLAEGSGRNTAYVPFEVAPSDLAHAADGIRALGILGVNVTIPHKKEIIPYLDELTPEARFAGAVNTVRNENGKLIGHNTDGEGWAKSLRRRGVEITHKKVVLVGAGGAAEGVGAALVREGAREIIVVNRTREKGEALAERLTALGTNAYASTFAEISDADILVNTTSVGMKNETETPVPDFSFMKQGGTVADCVYTPRETRLLYDAKMQGFQTVGGIGMLIEQAILSYEFFTGVHIGAAVAESLYDRLSFEENIILAGFMGTGKSTVGRALARHYSLTFVDTDEEIEKREQMSVSKIFAEKGEDYFREKEAVLIKELASRKGLVISLGGGAVLREENRAALKGSGHMICLFAKAETILKRVGNKESRPLIFGKTAREIEDLMHSREAVYKECGLPIWVDGKKVDEIIEEIVKKD